MYLVCSTSVSEEMLKGVQDANVCLWNTPESFTTAYKSNLIFHLNPCTSDICSADIHSAPVLPSPSHWLHEVSVTAEPHSLQHPDCLVLAQVRAAPQKAPHCLHCPGWVPARVEYTAWLMCESFFCRVASHVGQVWFPVQSHKGQCLHKERDDMVSPAPCSSSPHLEQLRATMMLAQCPSR